MDTIAVLDFGSQTTQLIGRRIRDLGVYSEVLPGTEPIPERLLPDLKGVILGGSPSSVHETDAPRVHERVFDLGVPVLGICFGLQQIVDRAGGSVSRSERREYGRVPLRLRSADSGHPLFRSVPDGFVSWMSHGDSLERLPDGFSLIAESENGLPAAVVSDNPDVLGIQFHPEVTHCEFGTTILENFALCVCGARRQWSMKTYVEQARLEIRRQVGRRSVLVLISGGVDSTVTGALLLDALDADQVHLMYIDTGLMRKDESVEVKAGLEKLGARHLHLVDASDRFFAALEGQDDPEVLRLVEVIDRDHPDDAFAREWKSFDPLTRGDLIGVRADGTEVRAPEDGFIVFPNPNSLPGNEWFYRAEFSDREVPPGPQ